MKSDPVRIKIVIYGIALLSCGWLSWKTLQGEQSPLTMQHVSAAIKPESFSFLETSPDVLIDRIIILSGLQNQIEEIGGKILQEIKQSKDKPDNPDVAMEMEKIVIESFGPEHFHRRLRVALKTGSDIERLANLAHSFNSPQMRKITEIEGREFDLMAFESFVENVTRNPLPTNRIRLLQMLESVTYTTHFAIELTASLKRAMRMGTVNDDNAAMNALDAELNTQKKKMADNIYQAMILTMAYVYRELDDLELEAYVQFYQTEEGEWFIKQAVNALTEAFRAGALQTGKRISELINAKKTHTKPSS
ncbi:MAG: hypothetical protein H6937_11400 [Burkholderiales bacterium]|nr:hypothetical protein [Burkholderiales bacterium]MDR4516442.1 hypothetical protein [Nitrosomonas sp.]